MPSRAWPVLEPGDSWGKGIEFSRRSNPAYSDSKISGLRWCLRWPNRFPTLASDELLQSVGGDFETSSPSSRAEVSAEQEREPLWLWFAILAASLLIVEMIWSRPTRGGITKADSAHA